MNSLTCIASLICTVPRSAFTASQTNTSRGLIVVVAVNGWVQWVPQYDVNKCPFQTDSPDTFAYRFVSATLRAFYCSVSDNVPAAHSVSREGTTNIHTNTHTHTHKYTLVNARCSSVKSSLQCRPSLLSLYALITLDSHPGSPSSGTSTTTLPILRVLSWPLITRTETQITRSPMRSLNICRICANTPTFWPTFYASTRPALWVRALEALVLASMLAISIASKYGQQQSQENQAPK